MTSSNSWICDGIAKNNQKYTGLGGAHPPHENYALDCEICGLPKESSIIKSQKSVLPKTLIPVALIVLGILGYGLLNIINKPQSSVEEIQSEVDSGIDNETTSIDNPDTTASIPPTFNPEWISLGDRLLFRGATNKYRDDGIEAFKNGNFADAIQYFEQAVFSSRNDPEVQIYLNNSKAALQDSPLKIAAVVPVDNKEASAKEMLRGIADAQTEFNNAGGIGGKLVQVIIANDSNKSANAQSIAQKLADNPEILGVIGHNSSSVSKAALAEYEKAELVMISPTSTATDLKSNYFFRTVPSDAASGKKLAEQAQKSGINNVAIFYDSNSDYSKSLQEAFELNFSQLGGNILGSIDISQQNFNPQQEIENIKDRQVDALALFPSTQTTSIAISLARANTELPGQQLTMLGGDALYSSDTLNDGGEAVNGLIIAIPWFAQSQPYAERAYERWIGTINWRTAASFDATKALLKALTPNPTRDSVLQNLESVNLTANETSGKQLSFFNGENEVEPVLVQIDSGSFGQSGRFENGFKLIQP
jgi:branched-chain amino acid transport system substrate-binding protein